MSFKASLFWVSGARVETVLITRITLSSIELQRPVLKMSGEGLIGSSVCFVVLTIGLFYVSNFQPQTLAEEAASADAKSTVQATLLFPSDSEEFVCSLKNPQSNDSDVSVDFKSPSLKSFVQATTAVADRELELNGLAVFSKLADACQPLVDVGKPKIQVNKIALIKIMDDPATCSLCDLAVNAQNAGYSVVIYFPVFNSMPTSCKLTMSDKLLIPLVYADICKNRTTFWGSTFSDSTLAAADRKNVQIRISQASNDLQTMALYLEKLYFWFLLGPIITLEWLRRKKKLCCVTRTKQVDVKSATGNEETVRLHSTVEESRVHYIQDTELEENEGELQHLIVTNNAHTDLTTSVNMHSTSVIRRVASILRKVICYVAVGCGWVILILAALPVGISSGGLSFFRFDEESVPQKNFWENLLPGESEPTIIFDWLIDNFGTIGTMISSTLTIWWPAVQIFCFFLYSRFFVKTTWTVSTNFSKLIRSDWFSSNIYLLVLCVVVPYCSYSSTASGFDPPVSPFIYFTVYNTVCTVHNFLFVIILNKHKFVTRYVFYISVCMICAYVESDIVAVFYFILNSQGSLSNIKLTALRTVAIGLTLTLSFNSSMHIIRKLMKPQESLFEGLSEK